MVTFLEPIINKVIEYLQIFGLPLGMLLIMLESIIPVLPLGVFIAFNIMAYGTIVGFIVSYFATVVGCVLAYILANKLFKNYINKKRKKNIKLDNITNRVENIKFTSLTLLMALPFTPAFLINIAAGIANVGIKKFMVSLLIGKISIVLFWGFIGESFISSVRDIKVILIILTLLFISYLVSKIVSKKMNIE